MTRRARNSLTVATLLTIFFFGLAKTSFVFGQEVKVVVSSSAGDRLTEKAPLQWQTSTAEKKADFLLEDSVTFQTVEGFGASLLEAGHDLP